MIDPRQPTRVLQDPASGTTVELVYAFPPQWMGERPEISGPTPYEILLRLKARWRTIAGTGAVGALLGLAISLATPNQYTATATALPPAERGGSAMLAQYSGLAAAAGVQLPGAPTSSVDAIMAILSSRRLREPLIERFALKEYYQVDTRDDVLKAFASDFSARNDKKVNVITIAVAQRDPARSADIANAAADLLKSIYNEINQSTASRERQFLEGRVKQAEAESAAAAKALSQFQTEKGAIEIESQTKATIEAVAKFQGELIGQQIELKALLASAISPDNPRVQLIQERVNAMTVELRHLLGRGADEPGVLIGLGGLPELSIAYVERFRAVKKQEAILTALTAQLEAARISEVRTSEVVTIVDRAFPPERKSSPPRGRICIAATGLGLVLGSLFAYFGHRLRSRSTDETPSASP